LYFSFAWNLSPLLDRLKIFSFGLGWSVAVAAGLASQIVAKEEALLFFKGTGATSFVLSLVVVASSVPPYDKLQAILFGKVYSDGM
jgi:hypothetical protein